MNFPTPLPLVSIGLPLFNEEGFIDSALESLRGQDYPNLEIVISDNASTDRTVAICERHAAQDPRIRIERAAINRGATWNFQHVRNQAKGAYFMWAAGHDLWSPNLVSECVALLERNERACVAFASCCWIGPYNEPLARGSGWTDTRGLGPVARLITIFWGNMHPIVGLIRRSHLQHCPPLPNLVGGDLVLLSALALRGDFVHATQATWSRRDTRFEQDYGAKLQRYASTTTGIVRSPIARLFPLLELPIALVRVILRSELRAPDKLMLLATLAPSLPLRYLVGRRGHAD